MVVHLADCDPKDATVDPRPDQSLWMKQPQVRSCGKRSLESRRASCQRHRLIQTLQMYRPHSRCPHGSRVHAVATNVCKPASPSAFDAPVASVSAVSADPFTAAFACADPTDPQLRALGTASHHHHIASPRTMSKRIRRLSFTTIHLRSRCDQPSPFQHPLYPFYSIDQASLCRKCYPLPSAPSLQVPWTRPCSNPRPPPSPLPPSQQALLAVSATLSSQGSPRLRQTPTPGSCSKKTPLSLLMFIFILALTSSHPPSSSFSGHSSSLSTSVFFILPRFFVSFALIHSCAAARNSNSHQRVDSPSPNDFASPLTGPKFAFTEHTPLGALADPREYADGALATQKLVAAPQIPLHRQLWPGVDTRKVYFNNDYSGARVKNMTQLLQTGMRRLVVDLWWDGTDLAWQLCPRMKRDGTYASSVRTALQHKLEQDQQAQFQKAPLQRMNQHGGNGPFSPEAALSGALAGAISGSAGVPLPSSSSPSSLSSSSSSSSSVPGHGSTSEVKGATATKGHPTHGMEPRSLKESSTTGPKHATTSLCDDDKHKERDRKGVYKKPNGRIADWLGRKKPAQSSPVDPKDHAKTRNKTETPPTPLPAQGAIVDFPRDQLNEKIPGDRLSMSKSAISSYDTADAVDQTVDGITCSTGDDLVILLQSLQTWISQTTEDELEDVILLILNLNELNTDSLGNRPPTSPPNATATPTPVPSIAGAGNGTSPPPATVSSQNLSNQEFISTLGSPNTNITIKAVLPNVISLKELLQDAFPNLIYTPTMLKQERQDIQSTWWRTGQVGMDYYNVSVNPQTQKLQAESGWPTSFYVTEVVRRRLIIGFGTNQLKANTSYNMTDDYTTIFAPGELSLPMSNSALIRVTPDLTLESCRFPVPGIMMVPTGSEEATYPGDQDRANSGHGSSDTMITWAYSTMSDSDAVPWSYSTGQMASFCGFSNLVESQGSGLSYSEQAAMSIWSWDLDQPPINQTRSRDRRCGVMQSNGRWAVQDCNLKLPVACRKTGTSSEWIVYDKGAANYRDVTCPEGYQFDVPRTARENQYLYQTLLQFWNTTSPSAFKALVGQYQQQKAGLHSTEGNDDGDSIRAEKAKLTHRSTGSEGDRYHGRNGKESIESMRNIVPNQAEAAVLLGLETPGWINGNINTHALTLALPGGGMIWIDISSWQTAGCWVPGGINGKCPYQEPDNTVALQEIIKVSSIGGVIILLVVGLFLYLKCRRNVRLRRGNRRRQQVRTKILRTEVETVPA